MISPHSIITKGDNILFKVGDTLDERIYKRIRKFISQNTKDGKVSIDNKQLAIIDDIILKEIKDSGYNTELNNYLALFTQLENAISQEQAEINKLRVNSIKELWNRSDPRHLEAHHITRHVDRGSNAPENLTTLCTACHDKVHASD